MDDKIEWMMEQAQEDGWALEEDDLMLYLEDIALANETFVSEFFILLVELDVAWEEAE